MTLSRSMSLKLTGLVLAAAVVGALSWWRLQQLAEPVDAALAAHEQWRQTHQRYVEQVGVPLIAARDALSARPMEDAAALRRLIDAAEALDRLTLPASASPAIRAAVADVRRTLRRTVDQLRRAPTGELTIVQRRQLIDQLDDAFAVVARLSGEMRRALADLQTATRRQLQQTATTIALLAALIVAGAILIGFWQHRSVMGPIARLSRGVGRIASGRFDQRLSESGHDELARLAADFNAMTERLESLYRDLEQKVADTSRELVRAERLASVGHLAAGVAHEINNPLGIIAGHAELALRRIDRQAAADAKGEPGPDQALRQTLQVVCDEAFRCKQITEKLLSLSRGGSDVRQPVSLGRIAAEVASLVADLPRYRSKRVEVDVEDEPAMTVNGSEAELKQVVLNLTLNALEAVDDDGGRVRLRGQRVRSDQGPRVQLQVTDNGRGMTAATLARVFEPFYTERRGVGEPGTGLGLSISHAIVADHEGRLTAASQGPGRGATFTIDLPPA